MSDSSWLSGWWKSQDTPLKPKLTGKKYKHLKLNITQRGFNTDFEPAGGGGFVPIANYYSEEEREKHRIIAIKGRCANLRGIS